ncbi:YopX family protein [Exiguobacterium sp. CinTr1]|uniref:YopX family protein n=1 Tax=Exiguobacterium sp. CinTr1 TaxID=2995315 RepID=UPI0022E37CAE|nr:YopX family protein [Exiguobacterium sp. CinTr1]
MREIKFRGRSTDDGFWIYGFGVFECRLSEKRAEVLGRESEFYIYTERGVFPVHGESIGQYTGLKDKNNTEIYEGDIFESTSKFSVPDELNLGTVSFSEVNGYQWEQWDLDNIEVIGKVYESPEILEKWYEEGLEDQ